jgi:acyl-coenzyme A thioesterase PaaI-like protein
MFEQQDGGEAIATWTPSRALEGFRGIIHGGVVSTVLDEAMSKAVAATGSLGVHRRAPSSFSTARTCSDKFLIRGWVVNENNRLSETEATLTAPDGTEYARAWARFLSVPKRSA